MHKAHMTWLLSDPTSLTLCREALKVMRATYHAAEVLLYEVRILSDSLRDGAEDDALRCELLLEGGGDGLGVKDVVIGHILDTSQALLLADWDAQLVKGLQQLWVNLIQAVLQRALQAYDPNPFFVHSADDRGLSSPQSSLQPHGSVVSSLCQPQQEVSRSVRCLELPFVL